jgi:molecular chaperone DnaJ
MADYYELLGVARDATQEEIKRAFRRLARETHPDANPGDPGAELRFREIAQAYEVLSDPQKRAAYDRGGSVDLGDLFSSFAGVDDLLSRFFGAGFGFGGARRGPAQGSDISAAVQVTLAEAATGVARTIEYHAPAVCGVCSGSGSAPDVPLATCERCSGQGSVRVTQQTFLGTTMAIAPCDRCNGRGRVIVESCEACRGAGSVVDDVSVTVDIPAGIEDGSRMRVAGRGAAGDAGGRPGDLFVDIRVESDERFERHGPDLVHRVRLGMAEAALGTAISVPTVVDGDVDLDIPAGTQPGAVFKLSRRGMPRLRRRGRGDLLVEVQVEVPTALTDDQEEALRAYAASMGEDPADGRRRRKRGR